jgi:hypothetical protein
MKSEIMITPETILVVILRTRDSSLRTEYGFIIGLGDVPEDDEVGGNIGWSEEVSETTD